jgi:hypothetical protein
MNESQFYLDYAGMRATASAITAAHTQHGHTLKQASLVSRNKTGNVNVTVKCFSESLLQWKSNSVLHIDLYVYACIRTCVACACACVHVALLIQHETRMRHIVTSFVARLALPYFSTLSHKRRDYGEKNY